MSTLRIATIQTELFWENTDTNLEMLSQKINKIQEEVDLIVLPEMFTTGFSMKTELAELPDGIATTWLKKIAQNKNSAICGSVMYRETNNEVYNRMLWANPDGTLYHYNKKHLFRFANEHNHYKAGNNKTIIQYNGFKIQLLVCYDLRFPVWIRRTPNQDFDVIVFVANWPEKRAEHWKALLKARAIENQCYVIGVNCVGKDGNNIAYSGDTSIIEPTGTIVYTQANQQEIATNNILLEKVLNYRNEFKAWQDADNFLITE